MTIDVNDSGEAYSADASGIFTSRLIIIGCLMLMAYLAFLVFYAMPELSGPRLNREIFLWPMVIGLGVLFWQGYQLILTAEETHKKPMLKPVIVFGVLFSLVAVCIENFHSTDLFGYINRGWQQVQYHLNPYSFTVAQIPNWENDPMITDHWVNNPSPYGFIYMLWVKCQVTLGQGDFLKTVWVFKLFNLGAFWITATLLYLFAQNDATEEANRLLYLWCWNPLILLQLLSNAHNDIWMGLGLLLAFFLLMKEKLFWLLPALTLATLTKYGAVIVLPFAVVYLLKLKHYKTLLTSSLVCFLMVVVSAYPYVVTGHIQLDAIQSNVSVSHGSLHHLLFSLYKQLAEVFQPLYEYRPLVKNALKKLLLLGFAVTYFYTLYVRFFKQSEYVKKQVLQDAVLMMFLLICVISTKYYPWYFGLFFATALFLDKDNPLKKVIILITVFQLLAFTAIGQAHMINYPVMTLIPMFIYRKQLLEFFKRHFQMSESGQLTEKKSS